MTAVPATQDPGSVHLRAVREELTRLGIVTDDPAAGVPVCFQGIPGAWCEVGLLDTGELVWTYLPRERELRPRQAAGLVLAVLGAAPRPGPAGAQLPGGRLSRDDAVGLVLAACGLTVTPVEVDYGDGQLSRGITATSPVDQARGHVRIIGARELRWECRFARPGRVDPGLSPAGIARAIAAALAGAVSAAG
jgi:hypothetical protein